MESRNHSFGPDISSNHFRGYHQEPTPDITGASKDLSPHMTREPNTQNRAPLMCLSNRDGNEQAWAMGLDPTTAAM